MIEAAQPQKDVFKVVEALKAGIGERLVAIILFGSRARGEASDESDWDLLIVVKDLPIKLFERIFALKRLLPIEWRGLVSLLVRTPEELEGHISSLLLDITLDGQILYDPQGWAESWLSKLREFIRKEGLVRERTEAGDYWKILTLLR